MIIDKDISYRFNRNFQSPKGDDQYFLTEYVYGLLKSNSVIHDSYLCEIYGGSPYPIKREGNCFIGAATNNACNITASFHICPIKCRPKDHLDWESC